MPASPLVPRPNTVPVTTTFEPQVHRGYEVRSSITQLPPSGDWSYSLQAVLVDLTVVPAEDRGFSFNHPGEPIPFNEAPSFALMLAKLQVQADNLVDNLIPRP